MTQTCSNCRYAAPKGNKFLCCKYAPKPMLVADVDPDPKPKTLWPTVKADEWCAEWNLKSP
jgi:hypothetical protein